MKKKAIDSILSFINRYRAVTFGALRMNIPHISDETIFSDTTRLCKRRLISYEKKKRDIDSTMYFSETFNREHTKTVFDNTEIAYQTALKAIGILRRYLKITYEEPSFFPIPVKFGYIDSEGEEQNAQLIYLEYWENQMMAKKVYVLPRKSYREILHCFQPQKEEKKTRVYLKKMIRFFK